jgi:hypothetical protein
VHLYLVLRVVLKRILRMNLNILLDYLILLIVLLIPTVNNPLKSLKNQILAFARLHILQILNQKCHLQNGIENHLQKTTLLLQNAKSNFNDNFLLKTNQIANSLSFLSITFCP